MNYFAGIINFDNSEVQQNSLIRMMDAVTVYDLKKHKINIMNNAGFVIYSHGRFENGLSGYYASPSTDITVYADARLYNASEIINKLGTSHEVIREAELIYRSYMKWGEDCLNYFIGDFAFVLWDNKNKILFSARDHIGIRPLFYYNDNNYFLIASDLDSILHANKIDVKASLKSLQNVLDGIGISSGETFYDNIFRISPGHKLRIKNNIMNIERYWYPEKILLNKNITFDEANEQFKELFIQAVKTRIPVQAKIGSEISGGLDSSSVYSVIKKYMNDIDLSSFSLRFGEYNCDEGRFINTLIENDRAKHYEIRVDKIDFKYKYNLSNIYKINPHWPIFSTYTMTIALMKKFVENNIDIGLSGQGGDQLTSGNTGHLVDMLKSLQLRSLYKIIKLHKNKTRMIKNEILLGMFSDNGKYWIKKLFFPWKKVKQMKKTNRYIDDFSKFYNVSQAKYIKNFTSDKHAYYIDNNPYLVAEKIYGIEFRHPFFDLTLVEFVASLPWHFNYNYNYDNKRINFRVLFRSAMKGILPEIIRKRRDKAEFSKVIHEELQAIDMKSLIANSSLIKKGIVERNEIEKLVDEYHDNKFKISKLWTFVNCELWYQGISK